MTDTSRYEKDMAALYQKGLAGGKGTFSSARCIGEDCILCHKIKNLIYDRSIDREHPLKQKARDISAKNRYYSNVVFLSNPREVVVFEYSDQVAARLIAGQMDPQSEWKFFFNPKDGRNIFITKSPKGPSKEQVEYLVEPRLQSTTLPDPEVLKKLYPLDKIHELVKAGKVQPFYQSKLEPKIRTEIRFLPSWLGLQYPFFYERIAYHYNITEEEYKAIQAGKIDPFGNKPAVPEVQTAVSYTDASSFTGEFAEAKFEDTKADVLEYSAQEDTDVQPACFGRFDETNPECTEECKKDGWADACKDEYAKRLESRKTARRLQRAK